MKPFYTDNAKDHEHESEEILDLLPPRFREISGSSTAMESFNLMNDDLISHRIIPSLDGHLRALISNARSGLIANRLRHLVHAAPPPPRQCNLLFRVKPRGCHQRRGRRRETTVSEITFIECAIRDKRLSPFPQHEFTALTIPHVFPPEALNESFVEAIGHKIIFWNSTDDRQHPFCYILNSDQNSDRSFRALDTSTIAGELHNEFPDRITKVTVGDRLIVLLGSDSVVGRNRATMLSLDVNSEKWSLLPECPHNIYGTPIPWKGKLYLVNITSWVYAGNDDTTILVPMHFDFQSNVWVVGGEENTTFARHLMKFPTYFPPSSRNFRKFLVTCVLGRCMISSKSGTLYAISQRSDTEDANGDYGEYPIGCIYAMDDLASGWRLVQCRKSEHTQQVDPFKLPKLPKGKYVKTRTNCWEINEHDILLVVVHFVYMRNSLWARYAWWTFNKDDGVKNYGYEELNRSALKNASDISLLKIEM